jgi:hypothetical protein
MDSARLLVHHPYSYSDASWPGDNKTGREQGLSTSLVWICSIFNSVTFSRRWCKPIIVLVVFCLSLDSDKNVCQRSEGTEAGFETVQIR